MAIGKMRNAKKSGSGNGKKHTVSNVPVIVQQIVGEGSDNGRKPNFDDYVVGTVMCEIPSLGLAAGDDVKIRLDEYDKKRRSIHQYKEKFGQSDPVEIGGVILFENCRLNYKEDNSLIANWSSPLVHKSLEDENNTDFVFPGMFATVYSHNEDRNTQKMAIVDPSSAVKVDNWNELEDALRSFLVKGEQFGSPGFVLNAVVTSVTDENGNNQEMNPGDADTRFAVTRTRRRYQDNNGDWATESVDDVLTSLKEAADNPENNLGELLESLKNGADDMDVSWSVEPLITIQVGQSILPHETRNGKWMDAQDQFKPDDKPYAGYTPAIVTVKKGNFDNYIATNVTPVDGKNGREVRPLRNIPNPQMPDDHVEWLSTNGGFKMTGNNANTHNNENAETDHSEEASYTPGGPS